ncbi:MAG: hypothetical protein ACYC5W_02825 [Thauera sp.]
MSVQQPPALPLADCSAGECCARAQAASYARAEALRFAPPRRGPLARLHVFVGALLGRARSPRS